MHCITRLNFDSAPSDGGTQPSSPIETLTPTHPASGAYNGTRLATFNTEVNSEPVTHLFYQDFASRIRQLQKAGLQWTGGPDLPPVLDSPDVRNATPLACVNYTAPNAIKPTVRFPKSVISSFIWTMIEICRHISFT